MWALRSTGNPWTIRTPEQLRLDLSPLVEPIYEPTMTPVERFAAFHQANPASPEPSRPCAASGSHATQRWASRRSSKTFDGNRA